MNSHPSHDQFDDELLSAYVDDELSTEERARVEERLARDPDAKQLVDELRALSRTVKGLPRDSVDEGLRDRVLAAVTPKQASDRGASSNDAPVRLSRTSKRSASRGVRRGLAWAAVAIAASLALAAWLPEEPNNGRELAKAPTDQQRAEPRSPDAGRPQLSPLPTIEEASPQEDELERLADNVEGAPAAGDRSLPLQDSDDAPAQVALEGDAVESRVSPTTRADAEPTGLVESFAIRDEPAELFRERASAEPATMDSDSLGIDEAEPTPSLSVAADQPVVTREALPGGELDVAMEALLLAARPIDQTGRTPRQRTKVVRLGGPDRAAAEARFREILAGEGIQLGATERASARVGGSRRYAAAAANEASVISVQAAPAQLLRVLDQCLKDDDVFRVVQADAVEGEQAAVEATDGQREAVGARSRQPARSNSRATLAELSRLVRDEKVVGSEGVTPARDGAAVIDESQLARSLTGEAELDKATAAPMSTVTAEDARRIGLREPSGGFGGGRSFADQLPGAAEPVRVWFYFETVDPTPAAEAPVDAEP